MPANVEPERPSSRPIGEKQKPWRMSWVLIAILLYALIQMTYFVFFAEG